MPFVCSRSLIKWIVVVGAVLAVSYTIPLRNVFAHDEPPPEAGGQYTPDTCVQGHNVCGDFVPLTPMHGAEGVHAGLVWKDRAAMPKILYWGAIHRLPRDRHRRSRCDSGQDRRGSTH